MDESVGHETALLLQSNYDSLMAVWKSFRSLDQTKGANLRDFWELEHFWGFASEFKLVKLMKPLTLRRVFFVHAKGTSSKGDRSGVQRLESLDAFLDMLVLIAEKVDYASQLKDTTGRVLMILHHMNDVCFETRLAHLRPLFVLPPLPEKVGQEKIPQGWKNMLNQLPEEEVGYLRGEEAMKVAETPARREQTNRAAVTAHNASGGYHPRSRASKIDRAAMAGGNVHKSIAAARPGFQSTSNN